MVHDSRTDSDQVEEPKLFADTIDPVCRSQDGELFLIRIEAIPKSENPEAKEYGGAFVNGWADAQTLRESEERTVTRILEEGWMPVRFDHWEIVCRDCYTTESHTREEVRELQEAVDEAFEYGVSVVFHTWPVGAVDEDENED